MNLVRYTCPPPLVLKIKNWIEVNSKPGDRYAEKLGKIEEKWIVGMAYRRRWFRFLSPRVSRPILSVGKNAGDLVKTFPGGVVLYKRGIASGELSQQGE